MNRSQMEREHRRVLAGLLLLALLSVLAAAVFLVDLVRRSVEEGPHIVVMAVSSRGLLEAGDVWLAGKKAGRITDVLVTGPGDSASAVVEIRAAIDKSFAHFVHIDSRARVVGSSLLGPRVLSLQPGSPESRPVATGDTLWAEIPFSADSLLKLSRTARAALDTLAEASGKLRTRLAAADGSMAALGRDTRLANRFSKARERAAHLSAIARQSSLVHPDKEFRASARRIRERLRSFADTAGSREAAGAGLRPDSLMLLLGDVEALARRLTAIEEGLAAARGSAGRFMADDELARQLDKLRGTLEQVRTELARQPLRWLRFRLF